MSAGSLKMARTPLTGPLPLLLALLGASEAAAAAPRVWTVFCAECTNNFDYK